MIIPKAGDRLIIDNAWRTIKEVTTMYENLCAVYETGPILNGSFVNQYINIKALHLHSSQNFWFKEPLVDKIG